MASPAGSLSGRLPCSASRKSGERAEVAAIIQGRDPKQTQPQRQLAGMTVAQILEAFLADNSNLRPATIRMYRFASKHLGPLLDRALREITPDMLEQRFRAIEQDVAARRAAGMIVGGTAVTGKATSNAAVRLLGSLGNIKRNGTLGWRPIP